jgi:hypothetical protein
LSNLDIVCATCRHVRHDDLGVLQGELVEANLLHMRQHVEAEQFFVAAGGALLSHVIGKAPRKLARRPLRREVREGRYLGQGVDRAGAQDVHGLDDRGPRAASARLRSRRDQFLDLACMPCATEARGHLGQGRLARLGLFLRTRCREHEVAAGTTLDRDPGRESVCEPPELTAGFTRHGSSLYGRRRRGVPRHQ